jgi:hypothetical protein
MTGTPGFWGLPASIAWLWRWTATRLRLGVTGDDHEALTGFASHDVNDN